MSTEETALPESVDHDAGASEPADNTAAADQSTDEATADATAEEAKGKPEKTEAERELARAQRRIDNLTRQKYELRAQLQQQPARAAQQQQPTSVDDDEPVTLTRAELNKRIAEQATQLAPTMREQQAEVERRHSVVTSLAKEWGPEKFDTLSAELDEAFGGLIDRSGTPKPATDAIFHADDPKAVIEYLTDPDNADEADRISKLSPVLAGKAIARLEDKLAAEKLKDKPKPSKAPAPLEPARGGGVPKGMPDPSDTKAYMAWANAQDRAQR